MELLQRFYDAHLGIVSWLTEKWFIVFGGPDLEGETQIKVTISFLRLD